MHVINCTMLCQIPHHNSCQRIYFKIVITISMSHNISCYLTTKYKNKRKLVLVVNL